MMFGLYISEMKTVETRSDLLKLLPKGLRIAELGVFRGDFSKEILDICQPSKLYLVDLFEGEVCCGDKDGENVATEPDLSVAYFDLKEKYRTNPRVKVQKMHTWAFLETEPVIDAVYIDSQHSFGQVQGELCRAFRNLSVNYILGHDYDNEGVKRAVDEFCRDTNLEITYLTNDKCPSYLIEL